MDLALGNGTSNEHLDVRLDLCDESGSSKCRSEGKDVELMDDRSKPEIVDGDSRNHIEKRLDASSSSNSFSDASLDDHHHQVDTSKFNISSSRTSIHEEAQPASKNDENSAIHPYTIAEAHNGSGTISTSQPFDVSHETVIQSLPPTLNPPTQVMDRSAGYDPNRIPCSVFAASPVTPMDWSLASNESLFSIHVGSNSFPIDTKFSLDDLGKPEELPKSGELTLYSPTVQVPQTDDDDQKNDKLENEFGTTGRAGETMTEQPTESEQQTEVKRKRSGITWKLSYLSSRFDGRGKSEKSFAFPNLTDGVKNVSSKTYTERQPSASPMKTISSSTDSWCWSCCSCRCCCSFSCCYFPSCPSCIYFPSCPSCPSCRSCSCKSISCSHCC